MMSSVSPSAKYSSVSALKFVIGSTSSTGLGSSQRPVLTLAGWPTAALAAAGAGMARASLATCA